MQVQVHDGDGEASFNIDGSWVRFEGEGVHANGDAALCLALFPSLAAGETVLEIDAPVDPQLCANVDKLVSTAREFFGYPEGPFELRAPEAAGQTPSRSSRTAAAFTAGADSFYTALERQPPPDELVFALGYDVTDEELERVVLPNVQAAADGLNLPLRIIRTDLRAWSDRWCGWAAYHGAAIAALGHLLRGSVGTFVMASSHYQEAVPWGTHPDLDPLWSSTSTPIEQHGAYVRRSAKIAAIAAHPVVRQTLRVCFANRDGAYNCGRCEKCIRTMLSLEAAGALGEAETMPPTVTVRQVLGLSLKPGWHRRTAIDNAQALKQSGRRPLLRAAVLYRIRVRGWRHHARKLRALVRRTAKPSSRAAATTPGEGLGGPR